MAQFVLILLLLLCSSIVSAGANHGQGTDHEENPAQEFEVSLRFFLQENNRSDIDPSELDWQNCSDSCEFNYLTPRSYHYDLTGEYPKHCHGRVLVSNYVTYQKITRG